MMNDLKGRNGPLVGLSCMVCGMDKAAPVEADIVKLGGTIFDLRASFGRHPDVIVSESACSKRLQVLIGKAPNVPTVTSAWVAACAKTGCRVSYESYRLPVLKNCLISFTNVAKTLRSVLQKRIEDAGGRVAADMSRTCNYLVVGDSAAPSMKLKAAEDWRIVTVTVKWLDDCIAQSRILPTSLYRPTARYAPAKQASASASVLNSTSATNGPGQGHAAPLGARNSQQSVDRTASDAPSSSAIHRSTAPAQSQPSGGVADARQNMAHNSQRSGPRSIPTPSAQPALAAADVAPAMPAHHGAGPGVALPGVQRVRSALSTQDTNSSGSDPLRPSDGPRLAHPLAQTQAGALERAQVYLAGVLCRDSHSSRHRALLRDMKGTRSTTLTDYVTHIVVCSELFEDEQQAIAAHVATRGGVCHVVASEWLEACQRAGAQVDEGPYLVDTSGWEGVGDGAAPGGRVFEGHMFCLDALDDPEERRAAKEYIRTLGGQELVTGSMRLVSDWDKVYAICPKSFPPEAQSRMQTSSRSFGRIDRNRHCNVFWLKICLASQTHVPCNSSLFSPIPHAVPFADFSNVCVVMSGYGDGVRRGISYCIELMGGQCLDSVAASQWQAVTHLVIDRAEGKKYAVCQSKGIPAVSTSWLTTCMQQGRLVAPNDFLVTPEPGAPISQSQRVPACLEATQAELRPQSLTQGGLRPGHSRRLPQRRTQSAAARALTLTDVGALDRSSSQSAIGLSRLGHSTSSILQQLSQELTHSRLGADANNSGPTDFRDLSARPPGPSHAPGFDASMRSSSLCAAPQPAPAEGSGAVLQRLALAHGLGLDTIPSIVPAKRFADGGGAVDAKRPCGAAPPPAHDSRAAAEHSLAPATAGGDLGWTRAAAESAAGAASLEASAKRTHCPSEGAAGGRAEARDPVAVGLSSARMAQPAPKRAAAEGAQPGSRLSEIAEQCARLSGVDELGMQQSQVFSIFAPAKLGRPPKGPFAASARAPSATARSRRQARFLAQEATHRQDKVQDAWSRETANVLSTQVAFSQQVDFVSDSRQQWQAPESAATTSTSLRLLLRDSAGPP